MGKTEPVENESPYPECRVTATTEPLGMIRMDVSRKRAAVIAKRAHESREEHTGEGLIPVKFHMPREVYAHVAENLTQLLETEAEAVQAILSPDPEVSISVILSRPQIEQLSRSAKKTLELDGDHFAWEASLSRTGVDMLITQVRAAINGEDDPLTVVDRDD